MAIVSLMSGLLAFLLLPIVLGPLAVITGAVGMSAGRSSQKVAMVGLLLGIAATLFYASRIAAAFAPVT
jgi:hypothetical protein